LTRKQSTKGADLRQIAILQYLETCYSGIMADHLAQLEQSISLVGFEEAVEGEVGNLVLELDEGDWT